MLMAILVQKSHHVCLCVHNLCNVKVHYCSGSNVKARGSGPPTNLITSSGTLLKQQSGWISIVPIILPHTKQLWMEAG